MYKDFVNVTPESGGAGTTPIAVAADENEGDGWERMEFMWENTFEGYQYWRNTTPNVYPNEYPTVKTVQMRVGIGDNTDPEPIHTYLAQFTVNIILSPRP